MFQIRRVRDPAPVIINLQEDRLQNRVQNHQQGPAPNPVQDQAQNRQQGPVQNQVRDQAPNHQQDRAPDQVPGLLQDRAPDLLQVQDLLPDLHQDPVQGQADPIQEWLLQEVHTEEDKNIKI